MFTFLKTKNKLTTLIAQSLGFCFAVLFAFSAVYTAVPAYEVHAQPVNNVTFNQATQGNGGNTVTNTQNNAPAQGDTSSQEDWGIFDTLFSIFNYIQRLPNTVLAFLAQALLTVCSFVLWMGGEVFEIAIKYSIVEIKTFASAGGGILIVWKVFRDLANMSFIFILLYAAIQTILDIGGVQIQKLIKNIVIAALLINFSLFFTQIAIDASNIVAVAFYNQIVKTKCGSNTTEVVGNLGSAFMCKLGLTSIIPDDIVKTFGPSVTEGVAGTFKLFTYGVAGSALILIAAFIFFASAMMFVVRFVKSLYFLVVSPLAFASIAIPNSKYFGEWRKGLIENCLIAPIYMAATWAAFVLLGQIGGSSGSLLQAIIGDSNGKPIAHAGEIFLKFIITIVMMSGGLFAASKYGAFGAAAAHKSILGLQGWAQGKLGRGALRATGLNKADELLANTKFGNTRIGRDFRALTTSKIANAKFGSGDSISSKDAALKTIDESNAEGRIKIAKSRAEKLANKNANDIDLHETNFENTKSTIYTKNSRLVDAKRLATDTGLGVSVNKKYADEATRLEKEIQDHTAENKINEERLKRARENKGATDAEKKSAVNEELKKMQAKFGGEGTIERSGAARVAGGVLRTITGGLDDGIPGAVRGAYWGSRSGTKEVKYLSPQRKAIVGKIKGMKKDQKTEEEKEQEKLEKAEDKQWKKEQRDLDKLVKESIIAANLAAAKRDAPTTT